MEIKEIREKLGLTQAEFAKEIGVDTVTVSRWENDKRRPSKLAQRQLFRLSRKVNKGENK